MKTRFLILVLSLAIAFPAIAAKPSAQDTLYEQIRHNIGLFGDVYREISLKYVDSIDPEKFVRAGIEGMLSTLDPYTVFMDEEEDGGSRSHHLRPLRRRGFGNRRAR